jgi:hypothetical protein
MEFRGCLEDLRAKEFGGVSPDSMLRVLAALITGSAKRETILNIGKKEKDAAELRKYVAEVREAMKRAVDFLTSEVHVKSLTYLPYERQFVVVSHVLSKKLKLSASENEVLRRWFWRTSFAERYRRGGEGLFDEDLRNVIEAFQDPTIIAGFGNPPTHKDLMTSEFRKGSALASAFVALLASAGPRNLINGSGIDVSKALSTYNRKEFHHVFPQAYLRSQNVELGKTNSLVNFCMLSSEQNKYLSDRKPSDYIAEIEASLGKEFVPVLEGNLIPTDAIPKLKADDYDGILDIRAKFLADIIGKRV